ncbi:MAG: hypothetical protein ACRYG7_20485 [Janthinobacterium lividum]
MHVSIDALDSALLLMDNWEHNRRTELKPGHWLHILSPRSWPGDPLYPSWTWQVVAGEGEQLMLRADGLAEQLVLTQDLADDLIIFTSSERVFLADYLEVLSWYRACRWGPCLLDDLDQGDITVTADRYGSRLNTRAIGVIPVADIDQPEVVWLHLVEMLYALTHPRKAKAIGHKFDEEERISFLKEMRRKVTKLAAG